MYFSTDIRSQILDLGTLEEVGEAGVCVLAMIVMVEDCKRRVSCFEISPDKYGRLISCSLT
jgi:hypothetical protein